MCNYVAYNRFYKRRFLNLYVEYTLDRHIIKHRYTVHTHIDVSVVRLRQIQMLYIVCLQTKTETG